MPRFKDVPAAGVDRHRAWRWLRTAETEALWWPETPDENEVPREEMTRLQGELSRGASPEAVIADAKVFLAKCGVLEMVERVV
jgi:hypothetical protein